MVNMDRPENPAKTYLKRYRACIYRVKSLERAIDEATARATSITVRLKPISVQNGNTVYDQMAEEVCKIADITVELREEAEKAWEVLAEILKAIDAVPDEMQKTVLTLRYIEGLNWMQIAEKIGYEISNTYILHGRALWAVNQWMKARKP